MNSQVIIETDRLILRRFMPKDFNDLYEYMSDSEAVKFEPYKAMNVEETVRNLQQRILSPDMIAVERKSDGKMIGNLYFAKRSFNSYELGYVFNRAYWRNGYAKESCAAVISNAFSNRVHRIYAECSPENVASWKLLESLGFTKEANLKQNIYFWTDENGNPIWIDTLVYSLLNYSQTK